MKKFIFLFFSALPVRVFAKVFLGIWHVVDRIFSHSKFKALVKNSGQSVCHWSVEIKYGEQIKIGDFTSIGPDSCLGAKSPITIGNHVRISRGVILETAGLNFTEPPPYKHISKPITIEDGVWIASNAIVLGGVTIGANAIIGAGAVVSKDVKSGEIIVGQPFRVLDKFVLRGGL